MTVQDIDIAHGIWGKNIADLKGKNTGKKPIQVTGEMVKNPKEIMELHKEVFMTEDILFVNGIPFFILLNINITFTSVIYIEVRKPIRIFKSLR